MSPILGLVDEGTGWLDSSLTTGTPCVLKGGVVATRVTSCRAWRDAHAGDGVTAKDLLGRDQENYEEP